MWFEHVPVQHVFNTNLEMKYLVSLLIIFIISHEFIDICFNVKRFEMVWNAVLPHRTFLKVLYFFFTISRFCTFFVLFSGHVLFLYFFFINLAEFYQILFKSTVFVLFLEILQNECFAYLQGCKFSDFFLISDF